MKTCKSVFACSIFVGIFMLSQGLITTTAFAKNKEEQYIAGTAIKDCSECPNLIVIEPGSFSMGSDHLELMRDGEMRPEGPKHIVNIDKAFAIGTYEITNIEFSAFVKENNFSSPSCETWGGEFADNSHNWRDPNYGRLPLETEPVVCISWLDAQKYVAWLSKKTNKNYRLPSESEWEYTANAGSKDDWPWGQSTKDACLYGNILDKSATLNPKIIAGSGTSMTMAATCNDNYQLVAPVGVFKPNKFGVYDMMGNVWEWVQDCSFKYYSEELKNNSSVLSTDKCDKRAIRGGSWRSRLSRQTTSFRGRDPEDRAYQLFGFRVARDLN
ncbi:MAG: hypothetical protein CMM25_04150 [Rhodospirillaceae bacterium]|nr:hypothetical protein [Rhodospirillaceae bacterium]